MKRQVSLPRLLAGKLYKTGQTRGADDDVIYQNRVARCSTVLIPFDVWDLASNPPVGDSSFESGFIVLIPPKTYFLNPDCGTDLVRRGLKLGENALVFYEARDDWMTFNPDSYGWGPALRRVSPLGGEYVARVPATTAATGEVIRVGFTTTKNKGAGIRVYEYANSPTIKTCRLQLEALFWMCKDAAKVAEEHGMSETNVITRRTLISNECAERDLLDLDILRAKRVISPNLLTMCPLCLEEVSAEGFFNRVEQAEGRGVLDLTITHLNLFHIEELRVGQFGHQPYNVGWGHHHCNVVVKDAGIDNTLEWMGEVIDKNTRAGYIKPKGT